MGGPTIASIKRLFAVSGNGCAFPGCEAPLVHEGKVTGRVCHIRGAKPGAARYDPRQTENERHEFGNLILMCPIHHDVIDADPVSYSVARLLDLKRQREAGQKRLELDEISADKFLQQMTFTNNHGVASYVNQSVSSVNQQGGITAHTVNLAKARREMGSSMKRDILSCVPREKMIVVWSIAGNEETSTFADEIYRFLKEHGYALFGDGPAANVYIGAQPRGVTFYPSDPCNEIVVGLFDGSETLGC